jgi:hypothetical protein
MNTRSVHRFAPRDLALTDEELDQWRLFVGERAAPPATLGDLSARIERQARALEAGGSPDERLAAMLAREFARDACDSRRRPGAPAAALPLAGRISTNEAARQAAADGRAVATARPSSSRAGGRRAPEPVGHA